MAKYLFSRRPTKRLTDHSSAHGKNEFAESCSAKNLSSVSVGGFGIEPFAL
jgi:hypothetical protein